MKECACAFTFSTFIDNLNLILKFVRTEDYEIAHREIKTLQDRIVAIEEKCGVDISPLNASYEPLEEYSRSEEWELVPDVLDDLWYTSYSLIQGCSKREEPIYPKAPISTRVYDREDIGSMIERLLPGKPRNSF